MRLVVSSQQLSALKEPTVLVNLQLAPVAQAEEADSAAAAVRNVKIELNAKELDAMIEALQKAQDVVQTYHA